MTIELTILYDNESLDASLVPDWGFSALVVNARGDTVLFDTGANGAILERNAAALGVRLGEVSHVVLSHWHWDHTGGLDTVIHYAPEATYHVPPGVGGIPPHVTAKTVGPEPVEIAQGVYSTGVQAAASLAPPVGILGGFHGFSRLERLESLSRIYPCHCTQRTAQILARYPETASRCAAGFRLSLPQASAE